MFFFFLPFSCVRDVIYVIYLHIYYATTSGSSRPNTCKDKLKLYPQCMILVMRAGIFRETSVRWEKKALVTRERDKMARPYRGIEREFWDSQAALSGEVERFLRVLVCVNSALLHHSRSLSLEEVTSWSIRGFSCVHKAVRVTDE